MKKPCYFPKTIVLNRLVLGIKLLKSNPQFLPCKCILMASGKWWTTETKKKKKNQKMGKLTEGKSKQRNQNTNLLHFYTYGTILQVKTDSIKVAQIPTKVHLQLLPLYFCLAPATENCRKSPSPPGKVSRILKDKARTRTHRETLHSTYPHWTQRHFFTGIKWVHEYLTDASYRLNQSPILLMK